MLVVDDHSDNRALLVSILRNWGLDVNQAENGRQAVEVWRTLRPKLVWMDMRMPVMDGIEATRAIKEMDHEGATQIIAVTASAFEEDREDILKAGCDGFLRKPYKEMEIYEILVELTGLKFMYEDGKDGDREETPHFNLGNDKQDLESLPEEYQTGLKRAVDMADLDGIMKLIEKIKDISPYMANVLELLADDYEYDRILEMISKTESGKNEANGKEIKG